MPKDAPKGILDALDDMDAKRKARKNGGAKVGEKDAPKRDLDLDKIW